MRTEGVGRVWPVSIGLRRCGAYLADCERLLWPWQDVVRKWDPECGGPLMHHECHHREQQRIWSDPDETWTDWLSCEHSTADEA